MDTENKESEIEMGFFTKSAARLRDEAVQAVKDAEKHHAGCVEEYNRAVDHLATLKLQRLNDRKARTADAVAKRSGAESMADDDPALMRSIAKATLYKQGLFTAANEARLDVIRAREALAAAEKAAADAAYSDQARRVAQILGQLVPANELLRSMQTADLPLLSLPEWSAERWEFWQREYLALVEPKVQRPEADPNTVVTFIRNYSPGRLSGKRYNEGESAAWPPETAAEIVAGGFAVWRTPTKENEKLTEAAKHRLSQIDRLAGVLSIVTGGNE